MVENIKENGNMVNNTEKANSLILKISPGKKGYGAMDAESNGIILRLLKEIFNF